MLVRSSSISTFDNLRIIPWHISRRSRNFRLRVFSGNHVIVLVPARSFSLSFFLFSLFFGSVDACDIEIERTRERERERERVPDERKLGRRERKGKSMSRGKRHQRVSTQRMVAGGIQLNLFYFSRAVCLAEISTRSSTAGFSILCLIKRRIRCSRFFIRRQGNPPGGTAKLEFPGTSLFLDVFSATPCRSPFPPV